MGVYVFISLGCIHGMELLDHMLTLFNSLRNCYQKLLPRASLVVHWLELCITSAEGTGLIPSQGPKEVSTGVANRYGLGANSDLPDRLAGWAEEVPGFLHAVIRW